MHQWSTLLPITLLFKFERIFFGILVKDTDGT